MDNRRANYRHPFPPPERIPVELDLVQGPGRFAGRIADLSVSGMGVEVTDGERDLAPEAHVRAKFRIQDLPFSFECRVVHCRKENRPFLGLQFLRSADPTADEERERKLWKFLLDEQRRLIRARRERQGKQAS